MTTAALPTAANPAHLTDALRRCGVLAGGRVSTVEVEHAFPTVLSHIFRLRLGYDGTAAGAPQTLILKAGLLERPGGPWKAGAKEVAFYTDVAAAMPAGHLPRCFDAHADPDTGAWHLLLEDLTDTHGIATTWPLPPSVTQCEAIIRTRARFHAAWWDHAALGVSVGSWDDGNAQSIAQLSEQVERFTHAVGDLMSAERRTLYARLIEAAPRLFARGASHRHMTVVQGDAHVWNCFLPLDGAPDGGRLFDWDSWRLDVATDDLAYMMAVHWYPDLRRRIERDLLDTYHDELLARGVHGYDRRALQDDYRLSVLWQVMQPVGIHAFRIPPVIWWNNFERVHLAVDDLGCRDLL